MYGDWHVPIFSVDEVALVDGADRPARRHQETDAGGDAAGARGARVDTVEIEEPAGLDERVGAQPGSEAAAAAHGEAQLVESRGPGRADWTKRRLSRASRSSASEGSDRSTRHTGAPSAELAAPICGW